MVLWTVQSIAAWHALQLSGHLRGDPRYIEDDFLSAYIWMAKQMHERLGFRPSENSLPVWAWYQWQGAKRQKPDLRSGGHLPKGERGVRIEIELGDSLVLLSDFELWHYVLNYWYLPSSEEEGEAFELELAKHRLSFFKTKPLPSPVYHKKIEESWTRIFNTEWAEEGLACTKAEKSLQATFWELSLDHVKSVREFIAR